MDAIVYTSNSGFTAEYARLLGEKTGLPVVSLAQSGELLAPGAPIIYLGWLMAGTIKGYKKAAKRYTVRAVCGVGMGATGSQTDDVRKANPLPAELPVFVLQGGFALDRLHGLYKFMMTAMAKGLGKRLAEKPDKTPEETDMLDLLQNGGSRVSEENLTAIWDWYQQQT